jgi:hypothetical protein
MRTLSAQELDDVFAGQSTSLPVSATIERVTVTAPHYSNSSLPFPYAGSSWRGASYNENGDICYSGAGSYFAVFWRDIPNMADVRCEMNKAADPGMTMPDSATFAPVNDYAFKDRTTGDIIHKASSDAPPNTDYVYGQTDAAHNAVYVYAAGFTVGNTTEAYRDVDTGAVMPPWQTNMTPFQHALLVAAHESAHGRGVTDELVAEGHAVSALKRWRANPNLCP